jgi:selenocysteine lyase
MESGPIYLDYNGTCPMDAEVQEAISTSMRLDWQNPSSRYGEGPICKKSVEDARKKVAAMISASPEEIIFMSGGTEANNTVIHSVIETFNDFKAESSIGGLPHIVTSQIEHDSVSKTLEYYEAKGLCDVTRIPVQPNTGAVSPKAVIEALRPNTCLITVMWANNETGVVQPIDELARLLKEANATRAENWLPKISLHTDAAQMFGKLPVDVQKNTEIDYLTIVGHKFYGPRIGALFVRNGTSIHPMLFGGGQENSHRPGTENTPMIVGLGKASELVTTNLKNSNLDKLRDYLENRLLEEFPNGQVMINFKTSPRLPNTSSVSFVGLPGTAADLLKSCQQFVASTGAACHSGMGSASAILLACGIPVAVAQRTVRFSVGAYTKNSDIDKVIKEIRQVIGPKVN